MQQPRQRQQQQVLTPLGMEEGILLPPVQLHRMDVNPFTALLVSRERQEGAADIPEVWL